MERGLYIIVALAFEAGFISAPDLAGIDSLSAEQRAELIKLNRDVILALLVRKHKHFLDVFCKEGANDEFDPQFFIQYPLFVARTLQVCTDLDVDKLLPVDVLEYCISEKFKAPARALVCISLGVQGLCFVPF